MRRNRIAFVENAGRIVVAQEGHQALEFVVQPAHHLHVDVPDDAVRFSLPLQFIHLVAHCFGKRNAICLTHARHPLLQRLGNERRIRFKRTAQHFRQVTQLPLIRIADLPLNDNALCARRFVVAPEEVLDFRAPLAQAHKVYPRRISSLAHGKEQIRKVACVDSVSHGCLVHSGSFYTCSSQIPAPSRSCRPRYAPSARCYPP